MTKSSDDAKQLGLALAALRWRSGKTQDEIERESGITQPTLSRYEQGHKGLGPEILQRLLGTLGQDEPALHDTLRWLEATAETARQDPQNRDGRRASVEAGQTMTDLLRRLADRWIALEMPPELQSEPELVPADDLDHARKLRQRMERHAPEIWGHLFQWAPDFRYWRLCELLCDESLELAADDPQQALAIAQGARDLARYLPYEERRSYRPAYALLHLAYAWHRLADPAQAQETAREAWAGWDPERRPRPEPRHEARIRLLATALRNEPE